MERPNKKDYLTTNQIEYNQMLNKYYDDLEAYIDILEKQLTLNNVVGQSEQYCDCGWFEKGEKKELNSYLVCKHCTKFL